MVVPSDWLNSLFKRNDAGLFIAYKTFGQHYRSRADWALEPNSVLLDPDFDDTRGTQCGAGINLAPDWWVQKRRQHYDIWELVIPADAEICVPYGTDGKFRVNKAQIVRKIEATAE